MTNYTPVYLKKTRHFCALLQTVPFIRAVLLNGSVAQGRATKSSDIDLLIIAKAGRIWTVRFFINFLGILTGQKRPKDEVRDHGGKFCFNYFLADNYLKVPVGRGREVDQYCADNYSQSILVWGDQNLCEKFFTVNKKLFSLSPRNTARLEKQVREDQFNTDQKTLSLLRRISEFILGKSLGSSLEKIVARFQVRSIVKDPRTFKYPDLIVFNQNELRFHPPKAVLEK